MRTSHVPAVALKPHTLSLLFLQDHLLSQSHNSLRWRILLSPVLTNDISPPPNQKQDSAFAQWTHITLHHPVVVPENATSGDSELLPQDKWFSCYLQHTANTIWVCLGLLYALTQNLETTDRITNRNVMAKGCYAPALSSWPSHIFLNLNLWETVNIMHPGSFSTLIQLKPQTVSRVHSRKLLNSSHSSYAPGHGRSPQTNLPSVHNFVRSYYCENSICDCICCGCRNSCWVSALHHQKQWCHSVSSS